MSSFPRRLSIAALLAFSSAGSPRDEIAVRRPQTPSSVVAWRGTLREGRPPLRGFRAPQIGSDGTSTAPIEVPREEGLRRATALVGSRLARDGLLQTTAAAIESLGVSDVEREGGTERLRAIGLPVDWLEFFALPGGKEPGSAAIVHSIAAALSSGANLAALKGTLAGATFAFRQSLDGFAVATESGEHEIGLVRLQFSSPSYYSAPGDGGCLDVARQLLASLPDVDFVASVEEKHLEALLAAAREWPSAAAGRLTLIPESLPVSQWAQDDGKPGLAPAPGGAGTGMATLVPRYASRGEDGAILVPGETFLAEGLAFSGARVCRSPLLFQGGDLLAVRDPRSGERRLLLGEANLWRNMALGLSRDQVLEAFRIEFRVDRCEVLPAVSFHIDQELTVRATADRLIAFVADPVEAVRIVLRCGVEALEAAGVLPSPLAAGARDDLAAGRNREFLERVVPPIASRSVGFGQFPESLASSFSRGAADSGVGNFERFLLAIDLLTSWSGPVEELPLDPHSIAYLRSFQRRDEERREWIAYLGKSGFEVARVPSLPEANRGIDYLNGVQDRKRFFMPAWGGLYAPLDQAALRAFAAVLGPETEVLSILTSESQRRGGGLHCSLSAGPKP